MRYVPLGRIGACWIVSTLLAMCTSARAQNIIQVAAELGITPESMVVAGFEPAHGNVVLSRIAQADVVCEALAAHRVESDAIGAAVTHWAEVLLKAPENDVAVAHYHQVVAALSERVELIESLCDQLFVIAGHDVPAAAIERLIVWRSPGPRNVPAQFRVRDRPDAQWKAIVKALIAEARAARLDEELDEAHAALLAELRSDPLVVQAAISLELNLAAMQAVFEQFGSG